MTTVSKPGPSAPLNSWSDSPSVSLLFDFVRQQDGRWVSMFIRDHRVILSFDPPGGEWTDRHFAAKAQATALFREAHDDLEELRRSGRLGLPVVQGLGPSALVPGAMGPP